MRSAASIREKSVFHEYLLRLIVPKPCKTSSITAFLGLQGKTNIFVTKLYTPKSLTFLMK